MRTAESALARVPRFAAALAVFLAPVASSPGPGSANPFASKSEFRETSYSKPEWAQWRVVLGGAFGVPASFASGWGTAAGWTIGLVNPVAEACDLVLDVEGFTFRYDDSGLRGKGATVAPVSSADFSDLGIGVHLHPATTGRRFYGLLEIALPDVSRPQIRWTDASGEHVQEGTEMFGLDPGWVFGFGLEQSDPHRPGGLAEVRFVLAPGSTRNTEYLVSLRAALTLPLPVR